MAKQSQEVIQKSTENSKKSSIEFSKIIVLVTGALFILSLIEVSVLTMLCYDTSSFATQQIVSTGGIFGAAIIFYLNKSKTENLSKGKIRFAVIKLRLEIRLKDKLPEEQFNYIMEELDEVDMMLDSKLDGALEESIQQEIETQYY